MPYVIRAIVLCSALYSGSLWALNTDAHAATAPGETIFTAKHVLACTLVKTSFKGGASASFFSQATEKSVEGYCHNRSGEAIEFSATEELLENLTSQAGRDVLIYLSSEKVIKDAKTDRILLDVKPADKLELQFEQLCGPPPGKQLYQDEEVFSRGFRLAQIYAARHTEEGWQIETLEGKNGTAVWGKDILVQMGRFCNADIHHLIEQYQPLVFHYVQRKENDTYFIESVQRMILAEPKKP